MASTNSPRPSLPPIQSLDMDRYRREELDHKTTVTKMSAAAIPTPTSTGSYPAGPPPPYSAAPHSSALPPTASSHHALTTPHTPDTGIHRSEGDLIKKQVQHSLPPLHDVIGAERPAPYSSESHGRLPHSSPRQAARDMHAMEPPPAPSFSSISHHHDPYGQAHQGPISHRESAERSTYRYREPEAYSRPSYPRSPPSQRREQQPYSHAEPISPLDREPQSSTRPGRSFSYGYAQYSPRVSQGPSAGASSAQIYQPSIVHPPPPPQQPAWKTSGQGYPAWENSRDDASSTSSHQESVKRHLDLYDVELALNEIAENSMLMLDFSRQYGARLHQTQRSGPVPGTLPAITEVDDLMNKSRNTLDSLNRMREVLVAQQAALFQQAQEQRFKTESEANKRNDSIHQMDDSKSGGFAGSEPKKRRGRATAPGRCHSCQRAETPEWRRGPDGARTLCNACGLHYAKLTRKAGANKASIGSSNLRPKSDEPESASSP